MDDVIIVSYFMDEKVCMCTFLSGSIDDPDNKAYLDEAKAHLEEMGCTKLTTKKANVLLTAMIINGGEEY